MIYVQAIVALLPAFMKLIGLFIKTPAEKQADFIAQLPATLVGIHAAFLNQSTNFDPSGVNKQLND